MKSAQSRVARSSPPPSRGGCRATDDPAELGPQDLVIVALKAPTIAPAIAGITALLGPSTTVIFLLNGIPWWYHYKKGGAQDRARIMRLDPEVAIWDAVGPQRD